MKVLISGAGIAGLSLARLLQRFDISYTLIEKKNYFHSDGAGIALPANAVKALRFLGLGSQIDVVGHKVESIIYAKPSGSIICTGSLLEMPLAKDHFYGLTRARLHDILLDKADLDVHFSTTIEDLDETPSGVEVTFKSPVLTKETFDLVVGADGLYSDLRKRVFVDSGLIDLGYTNWRWLQHFPTKGLEPTYQFGNKTLFMVYPVGKKTVYCYCHDYDPESHLFQEKDTLNVVNRRFSSFKGLARKALSLSQDSIKIIPGRLRSVSEPCFSKGHFAFVGDASSGCSPLLQQGAASSFEDVIALSKALRDYPLEKALLVYEEKRKERVSWIVKASDTPLKKIAQMSMPWHFYFRNRMFRRSGPMNIAGWKTLFS